MGIAVRDAGSARRTYSKFGFEYLWQEKLIDAGVRSHVMRAGDAVVELIESLGQPDRPSIIDRFLEERGEGLHHLCLRVPSLESTIKALKAVGLKFVSEKPAVDRQGKRVFIHPRSAHGVLIGLVEPHRDRRRNADRREIPWRDEPIKPRTFVAAVARRGTPLFVSGLTAVGSAGTIEASDVVGQARVIFRKLGAILEEAGACPQQVVKTTDYILSRDGYRQVAEVRKEFFGNAFPAATGVVVKELLGKGVLIEMDAVAIL